MLQRLVDIICALIGHKRRILGMYSYYRDQTKPICHKSSTFHMQSVVNIRSLEVWKGRSWIIEIVFSYHKFRFRTNLTLLITISGADVQSNSDPNLKKVHSRGIMLVHVQGSENHISDISSGNARTAPTQNDLLVPALVHYPSWLWQLKPQVKR